MKRIVLLIAILLIEVSSFAKVYDFESNDLGWNEIVVKKGEVLIKEGVLSIEGKNEVTETGIWDSFGRIKDELFWKSTCYLPIDVKKSFVIKVDAFAKKIKEDAGFGIIFNYKDNKNFEMFCITATNVYYWRFENGTLVGDRDDRIKFQKKKKADVSLVVEKTFDNVSFIVDDVHVLELPYVDYKYRGFGFFAIGEQTITFDNLETIIK